MSVKFLQVEDESKDKGGRHVSIEKGRNNEKERKKKIKKERRWREKEKKKKGKEERKERTKVSYRKITVGI